ncbi:helix-hairpin-helix domain-containing protein [Sporosarcina sp. 179-K 3D1 HS]|uniref:helix-hairpin-helix domain-containing protein n=1 Tax=Sporosarcina sp. 179-K 3D1 HS TaxID=3232169 RepID=UPI0039A3BB2E
MYDLFLPSVFSKWRKFITPLAAIAVVAAILFFPRGQSTDDSKVGGQNPFPELIEEETEEVVLLENGIVEDPVPIVVDVKGAVRYPGVHALQEGDRLIDAIHAAGGYLPDADTRMLNHAMKLADETVIYVPVHGEELEDMPSFQTAETPGRQEDGKVDINKADEQALMSIPGIGPAKAAAIIQYRTDNGSFQTPEMIMEVSGIGKKTFENLEPYIKVK